MKKTTRLLLCGMIPTIGASTVIGGDRAASIYGLTQPVHRRPTWVPQNGIVMAANFCTFLQRKAPGDFIWTQEGYGLSDEEARAAYLKENSPEMYDRLKELGVNMVILPIWSGLGTWEDERSCMEDSKRYAEMLRARGIRVGAYIFSQFQSDVYKRAHPEANEWLVWSSPDLKTKATGNMLYMNHPGYQMLMRRLVKYAIEELKADLVHFDAFPNPPGWSPQAINDFRTYLRMKYTTKQLREYFGGEDLTDVGRQAYAGIDSIEHVSMGPGLPTVPVGKLAETGVSPATVEWKHFEAWSLGEAWRKLNEYAHSLKPEVILDGNSSGISVFFLASSDLSLVLPYGDGFWYEQNQTLWNADKRLLNTSIRTFKTARIFNQFAITWSGAPQQTREAMAFNNDCTGCIYWFLYGRINWIEGAMKPGGTTSADESRLPEINFYRERRDLFGQGEMVTDVGVLRGRAVNIYGSKEAVTNTYLFEQAMITEHIPFAIIFDQHLDYLSNYKAVVLADVRMLDDDQIGKLLEYVENGGGLVITGRTAAQDRWGRRRADPLKNFFRQPVGEEEEAYEERGKGRIVLTQIERPEEFRRGSLPLNRKQLAASAVKAMGEAVTFRTNAPLYLGMEFIRQDKRALVNMLDYSLGSAKGKSFQTWVSPTLGKVKKACLLSPRQDEVELKVEQQATGAKVTVPGLDLYGVVAIDLE